MKMYVQPSTTTMSLNAGDRLCQAEVMSVGGNEGFNYGGEGLPGYKPM